MCTTTPPPRWTLPGLLGRALLIALCLLTSGVARTLLAQECRIVSCNVRYDNPEDSPHAWQARRDSLSRVILSLAPDVIGMQEVLHSQMQDLAARLPGYDYLGVGRTDGKAEGEYAPLWYRHERWQLVRTGYFWLSEQPDEPGSRSWDAACERIATWAILEDTKTSQEYFFLNTHLDHVGQRARREGARLILERIERYACERPVVLMGDLNAAPEDQTVQLLLAPHHTRRETKHPLDLKDAYTATPKPLGPEWTFHGFGRTPSEERSRIDYILLSAPLKVCDYKTIRTDGPELCLSDHNLIYTAISCR